jgi:hypothetical protein
MGTPSAYPGDVYRKVAVLYLFIAEVLLRQPERRREAVLESQQLNV